MKSASSQTSSNTSRTFAIGDIHGCSRELETLLRKINPQSGDRVIFLGDYVDRGPDARGVIDLILGLSQRCEVIALKGNHEAMFLDFLEQPESQGAGLFILNGGSSTLASYAGPGGSFEIPKEHIDFFYGLRLWYETDTHFFVHAGVPMRALATVSEEDEQTLLWTRQPFLSTERKWEKIVVHGHTPADHPELRANRINLDTGCVYDGFLTALELPAMKVHQVEKDMKSEPVSYLRQAPSSRIAMRFEGRLPVQANRPGERAERFETLNYNLFGILMRETTPAIGGPLLQVGDRIEGRIGPEGENQILFTGIVARSETRGDTVVYGVSIDRITNGNEGRAWIERPSEQAKERKEKK